MPWPNGGLEGGGLFLMSEVHLYPQAASLGVCLEPASMPESRLSPNPEPRNPQHLNPKSYNPSTSKRLDHLTPNP